MTGEPEGVFVPVMNVNYLAPGIVRLEGFVPPDNGGIPEDKLIQKQKEQLEAEGFESGPHPGNKYVDPDAAPDTDTDKKDVKPTPKTSSGKF